MYFIFVLYIFTLIGVEEVVVQLYIFKNKVAILLIATVLVFELLY